MAFHPAPHDPSSLLRSFHKIPLARRACTVYSAPLASDDWPVYEDVTIKWDPSCVTVTTSNIDLYLNVQQDSGLVAVHEWTDVVYADGELVTQLKPSWWNASTGAGSVSAQLAIVPAGSPSWDTPAPTGPLFTITYNGTYPASATASAQSPSYTGPSVESVAGKSTNSSSSLTGGKLGAAVAVPLLVLALALGAYLAWHKLRKRPEKKRWSAVIDQRMSMVSQGTWQPPRGSMSSRPGSFYPDGRQASSVYSGMEGSMRPHPFADPNRPNSAYSVGTPSPLGGGAVLRPLPPAEMRQVGAGERGSKISFAATDANGRPSFSSSRKAPTSIYNRSSMHAGAGSNLRHSRIGSDAQALDRSYGSVSSSGGSSPAMSRSGTREELSAMAAPPMPRTNSGGANARLPGGNAHQASVASSLRQDLAGLPAIAVLRDGQLAYDSPPPASPALSYNPQSPFLDSAASTSTDALDSPTLPKPPRPTLQVQTSDSHMPMALRNSMMSPDQALASYAVARDAPSPQPSAHSPIIPSAPPATAAARLGLTRAATTLLGAPGKMFRSLTSSSITSSTGRNTPSAPTNRPSGRPGATSPFDDPPSPGSEKEDPYSAFDEKDEMGKEYTSWAETRGEEPDEVPQQSASTRRPRTSSLPSRYSKKSDYRGEEGDEKEEVPFGVAL
ncbi:hypothetical protein BCR35DRAFT_302089 [Leucosporidium creatinivorum]|uniref:Uncharacterized protein n=1 Tax=Leucosporidium creatinivorum TaxID=106004 RepID=A0A1Y2FVU8_9BASI|nr:hypothetical protein BCR35DRAFT_302089 [Leucosporidium creatinivorum]